jgi:hypothetical protein
MKRLESTAEWIASELGAIFRAYSRDEVDRAMPLLLLIMGKDFGLENLEPRIRTEVLRVMAQAGLRDEMDPEEAQERISAFILKLNVNESMLREIKRVFDVHYEVLAETNAERFGKMLPFLRRRSAQKVGEARPPDTLGGAEMLRRHTGMIRS